jgi:hypothetical protein
MKTIGLTCAILLLAISAKAATTDVPGVLKRQRYSGAALTRQQVANNDPILNTVPLQTTYPTGWDWDDPTENYVSRSSGLITPPSTGLYDFYVAADDDTDVYLSTNDNPTNKVLICQENGWAGGPRNWITAGGGGSSSMQKSSLTWTNGAGVAVHSGGIALTAGTWYYLEAAHNQGGGGGYVGVTMLPHLTAPLDGDGTTLTNGLIKLSIFTPTTLSVAGPTNVTTHSGVRARFAVSVTTDSQDGIVYQWRRGGVAISNATASSYTLIASTSDNGAQFDCVVGVPGVGTPSLTQTSSVASLTVSGGGITITGALKRDLMAGMSAPRRTGILNGNEPAPTSTTAISVLDVGSAGANYGERVYGYFTPAVSDSYVFFIAADDDADVFLSTDSEPVNKVLLAQESGWSGTRNWITPGGAGSTSSQKRSDQWSPDGGVTFPHINGIPLTAGTPYYIEVVHNGGTGGNNLAVTAVTTNDVLLGIPVDGNTTTLSNAVLSYKTKATTIFQITQQPTPTNNTVFEGLPWQIEVTLNTDSEVAPTFQWFKNNVAVPGATTSKILSSSAILADAGTYRVEISAPGQATLVSSNAVLNVQAGIFVSGQMKLDRWLNDVTSRQTVGAGVPGTFPDPDQTGYVNGADVPGQPYEGFVQRVTGYFVPPTTGLYTFYAASDDDMDVYLGTNDLPSSKRIVCQEAGWSGRYNWNTPGGGGSTATQKRSDQWSPDGGATFPHSAGIQLTAGQRYYLEAVHHDGLFGDHLAVAYTMFGDPAPANGNTANVLDGNLVGVLVPAATVLTITNQPQSKATYAAQPTYFQVGVTSDGVLPPTFQWRRNGANIPGATFQSFGLIPDLADSGAQFDVVVQSPGVPSLTKTSTVATLTVNAGATFTAGQLLLERWMTNNGPTIAQIQVGGAGLPSVTGTVAAADTPDLGVNNYAQRLTGLFIPPVTTNYVFFVDSDDDSELWLGTNDQASSKLLRCQEPNWSPGRYNWLAAAGGGLASQKRSDQWSPDGGVTVPWAAGIPLVAGNQYYFEYDFREDGGGDWSGVYYIFSGDADPTNGAPANVTSAVIGRLVPPPGRVLTVTRSGGNVNVSWTPTGGTLQSTTALPGGSWTDVGTANPASIPVGPGNLFLRVKE